MPDISMCTGGDCPRKESCYRFTAKPSEYFQSYFQSPPYAGISCEYYWPIRSQPENNRSQGENKCD